MDWLSIPFRELPHTTRLFTDYVEGHGRAYEFFAAPPSLRAAAACARKRRFPAEVRSKMARILREQNQRWGGGRAAQKNIERLADGAAAVVTGQQVGLFGGPSYSVYKAVTAIHAAERLGRRGTDAVPVFWLAAEDHDLAEVDHTYWLSRRLGLLRLLSDIPAEMRGRSVGEISFAEEILNLSQTAASELDGPAQQFISEAIRESYTPGATFAEAFARLFARLFAEKGLVIFNPHDPAAHQLAAAIYRQVLERSSDLIGAISARDKTLERAGYHAQVRVTDRSTLLFLRVQGRREALRRKGGDFEAGGRKFTPAELRERLDSSPEAFSSSALLRPVVQDALFPTALYIAGPAEIAYLAQSQVLYEPLGVPAPVILARGSFTIVEPHVARLLRKYHLGAREAIVRGARLRAAMERRALPASLNTRFDKAEKELLRLLRGLKGPIERLDATLAGAAETAERKMLFQLLKLRAKAGRAADLRSGVVDRHTRTIVESLHPHGELQERVLNLLPILARNGVGLLDALAERSLRNPAHHHIAIG
jgi:bacillithiol biosynthesis cysteine-adding enzyme BshC